MRTGRLACRGARRCGPPGRARGRSTFPGRPRSWKQRSERASKGGWRQLRGCGRANKAVHARRRVQQLARHRQRAVSPDTCSREGERRAERQCVRGPSLLPCAQATGAPLHAASRESWLIVLRLQLLLLLTVRAAWRVRSSKSMRHGIDVCVRACSSSTAAHLLCRTPPRQTSRLRPQCRKRLPRAALLPLHRSRRRRRQPGRRGCSCLARAPRVCVCVAVQATQRRHGVRRAAAGRKRERGGCTTCLALCVVAALAARS